MPKRKQLGCDYQGSHFGAHYDDACCGDGYLWDFGRREAIKEAKMEG